MTAASDGPLGRGARTDAPDPHARPGPPSAADGGRWTARQLAMLQAMGIDFGARPATRAGAEPAAAPTARPAEGPADPRGAAVAPSTRAGDPGPPASRSTAVPSARPASPAAAGPGAAGEGATVPRPGSVPAPDRIERYIGDLATAEARAAAPAEGPAAEPAHWLVVGEPVQAGSPPAKLLAAMLRSVGLLADGGAPRQRRAALAMLEPGADLAFDRARLLDAVQRAAPRCVLVLGRAPARALLSTEAPLAELRGKVHRLGELPVVVTYAAAYLVRQPADKARAFEDLCLAVAASESRA